MEIDIPTHIQFKRLFLSGKISFQGFITLFKKKKWFYKDKFQRGLNPFEISQMTFFFLRIISSIVSRNT